MSKILEFLKQLNDEELISLYPSFLEQLKNRKIINTNNLVGELGEYYAINTYNNTTGLPKLQKAPPSTKNVDAMSINGERYAIKSLTGAATSMFHSIPLEDDGKIYFEYLVLVHLDNNYRINEIYELDWKQFKKFRKIHKTTGKYNITLNAQIKKESKNICKN